MFQECPKTYIQIKLFYVIWNWRRKIGPFATSDLNESIFSEYINQEFPAP